MSFGISKSVKGRVVECTPALFNQAVDAEQTAQVCASIREALERVKRGEMTREDFEAYKSEQKMKLPVLTPHASFPQGRRVNNEASTSGLSMYDVDHISDPRGYFRSKVGDRAGELGIVLAHVTPSSEGLRLIFAVPEGMSLEEAQKWMSQQLGDEGYDGCVKDLARCSFVVPRDYILYLDEEELFAPRSLSVREAVSQVPQASVPQEKVDAQESDEEPCFRGIPYSEIIREWWNRTGGEPQEGERNVKLHKLAVNLRAICDNRVDLLMGIMPRYGLQEAEMRALVESACKEPPKALSRAMGAIVGDLSTFGEEEAQETENAPQKSLPQLNVKKLPIGLKETLSGVPESMYMPVLCAVMPIAGAYADQVDVRYCDGNLQRLGLMSIIYGQQSSGKSVCKNAVEEWKIQFKKEDEEARLIEDAWKEQKRGRKANEKAPEDPRVVIRMVPVTVSCSTLLKRMKNAHDHTLYSFCEELDTLRKTNGAGSWSSKYDIYRLGFDRGEWGQDYNSDQAESGVVNVAYNWTILGTEGALRKCFKQDNIENGLSSRVLISEMPDTSFAKMPKYVQRTEEEVARIQEAVTRLRSCKGLIDTPRLRRTIERWVEEKRVEAAKDIDHVKDTYRKRAAVIGFRCGVIFHLLTGEETESYACMNFARMMAQYTLDQQIKAFGEALRKEYLNAQDEVQRYGANHSIYDRLPPVFTRDDLRSMKQNCSRSGIRTILMRWRKDGWIEPVDENRWQKASQASQRHASH